VVTGTTRVGSTLSVSNGTWNGSQPMTFTYQWLRCSSGKPTSCTAIGGATAQMYVATSTDLNKRLRARVTATNTAGSASATSSATAVVTS
jgi:hypothetical protein